MKRLVTVTLMMIVFLPCVKGQSTLDEKQSLKGIASLFVLIEDISDEVQRDGLSQTQLQTDIELRLRKAGIRVVNKDQGIGGPFLYLNITAVKQEVGLYAVGIQLTFNQEVVLVRDKTVRLVATTWRLGGVNIVGSQKVSQTRNIVGDVVDAFINDYLGANTK